MALIPNIVKIVKGYYKYESDTLKFILKLRSSAYDKMSIVEKIWSSFNDIILIWIQKNSLNIKPVTLTSNIIAVFIENIIILS